ncbi:MAG: hypothetical protein RIB65_15000 [Ilumatobacter fluminis]
MSDHSPFRSLPLGSGSWSWPSSSGARVRAPIPGQVISGNGSFLAVTCDT